MRRRLGLGVTAAALALLLAACGTPAVDAPARAETAASPTTGRAAPAPCPTTRRPDPAFVPPAPYPPTPPPVHGDLFWYGSDGLWTWLPANGTWPMVGGPAVVQSDKSLWWREGYDWRTETTPRLRITGRRLDAPAPAVAISDATNGFNEDIGAFMLVGLELPSEGCWQLTGHYAGRTLRFVVRVR